MSTIQEPNGEFINRLFPEDAIKPSKRQLDEIAYQQQNMDTDRHTNLADRIRGLSDAQILSFGLIATGSMVYTGSLIAEASIVESADAVSVVGLGAAAVGTILSVIHR